MNIEQAKEIAALSPKTYQALGYCNQKYMALHGEGYVVEYLSAGGWRKLENSQYDNFRNTVIELRIKDKTQLINGLECPAPIKSINDIPKTGVIFIEDITSTFFNTCYGISHVKGRSTWFSRMVKRGIVHLTEEPAIQACKARYGVKL